MEITAKILEKFGKNHTTPICFQVEVGITAIYTYCGVIYCLDKGEDFDFEEVSLKNQKIILAEIEKGSYVLDETCQG